MAWFGVRSIYHRQSPSKYTERVVIFEAETHDQVERAEAEGNEYALMLGEISLGLFTTYEMSGLNVHDGTEVFALVRHSELEPPEYLDTFFDTGAEIIGAPGESATESAEDVDQEAEEEATEIGSRSRIARHDLYPRDEAFPESPATAAADPDQPVPFGYVATLVGSDGQRGYLLAIVTNLYQGKEYDDYAGSRVDCFVRLVDQAGEVIRESMFELTVPEFTSGVRSGILTVDEGSFETTWLDPAAGLVARLSHFSDVQDSNRM